ncbi:hypothetical protein B0T10DRAFT_588127 [Thelonectria olida]|uniref:Uncharacterized protein n=1 Tax=Thelonectria olida TaxID=1576542 RepID=A0A9P9AIE9_9HYPO|nr:hypothetical protein B0T10DRAFT_588127 [Thelonectria olida]
MVRSSSAKPAKTTKRKGTRIVSTLTPSQLARKRANDREAKRAIRTQTKEHIERLERELEELKSKQSRDHNIQDLLRQNKALEDELNQLTEISMASSPYSAPVDFDNLSTGSGAIPSPRSSPFPSGYNSLPHYSQQYVPLPNDYESWVSTVPCPISSNVSSLLSSANTDDFNAGYIPTSVPTSMLPSNSNSNSNNSNTDVNTLPHKDTRVEYEDVESHSTEPYGLRWPEEANHSPYPEAGFLLSNPPMPPPHPSSSMQ